MRRLILAILLTILLNAPGLLAQTGRGTLTGIVTDSTGASVPGAAVAVTDAQTNSQRRAATSAAGVYTVTELPFGSYAVAVSKNGFRTAEANDIVITVNQVSRLDVRLEVGEVHQSIEVHETAEMLQKDSTTIQTNYDSKFMAELPLALGSFATRSPEAFTFLTPGVVGTPWLNTVNGGQTYSNSVLLDGASAGRTWHPGDFDESAPSVDALGEFSIKTNSFSAEYGRTGSAVTSFAYKSGTNRLHGAGYAFERNEALDAAGFYHQNTVDRKHDFGGTIGGPVYLPHIYDGRDRTFFFFSFEEFLTNLMADATPLRVPSELQKQGDFSELLKIQNRVQVYSPVDGTPFAGNIIPKSLWSRVSSNILPVFPTSNMIEPGTGLMRFYYQPQPTNYRNNLETVVLDHNFTSKQRFHYSWSRRNNYRIFDASNMLPKDNPGTRMRYQNYNTNQWRASLDTVLSPALLNHLNFGLDRVKSENYSASRGTDWTSQIGLEGVSHVVSPTIQLGVYMQLGFSAANVFMDTRYEVADNLTWVRGGHTLKFGGDLRRTRENVFSLDNAPGVFGFTAIQTGPNGGGDAFASFLLGALSSGYKRDVRVTSGWRFLYAAAFVQDDWKASSRLTVNMGLRWENDFPRVEVANRYSGLDPTMPNPGAGGIPGALRFADADHRHFDKTQWRGFGPRLGLAYALTNKTVIRTGAGIYYAVKYYDMGNGVMVSGFNAAPSITSPDGKRPAFNWDNGFPAYVQPPCLDPTCVNKSGIDYTSADTRPPYILSWNFGIERQITSKLKIDAFYVANKGTRLNRVFDLEQTAPENLALGDLLLKSVNDPAAIAAGIKAPYPTFTADWPGGVVWRALRAFPQYNSVNWINSSLGNSTYNSLQIKANQRLNRGLQFLANYTFSKNLTDSETAYKVAAGGFTTYQNDRLGKLEKSVSTADRPHILNLSVIYELPVGARRHFKARGVTAAVLGDWQLAGTASYTSGPPLSLYASCPSITQVGAGRCRPSYSGVGPLYGPGKEDLAPNNGKPYINPLAFTVPDPYTYGTTQRNMGDLRAPSQAVQENIGLMKRARLTERVTLQIRGEAFNLLNRVIFSVTDTNVGSYAANQPNHIIRNQTFGFVSGQANNPRTVQLSMKLLF